MTCSRNFSLYSSPSHLEESGVLCWPMYFPVYFYPGSFWCDFFHQGYHFMLGIFAMHNHLRWDHRLIFSAGLQPREVTTGYCCQGWPHLHLAFTGERLPGKCWDQDGLFPTRLCQSGCPQQLWPHVLTKPNPVFSLGHKKWWQLITSAPKWTGILNLKNWMAIEKKT